MYVVLKIDCRTTVWQKFIILRLLNYSSHPPTVTPSDSYSLIRKMKLRRMLRRITHVTKNPYNPFSGSSDEIC